MTNRCFYTWRVICQHDEIYYQNGIKLKNLKAPFRFELIPSVSHLKRFYIDIKKEEELIYFRRVKCHMTFGVENKIDWIRYCIGKKIDSYTSVLWIDAETGELQKQQGKDIILKPSINWLRK